MDRKATQRCRTNRMIALTVMKSQVTWPREGGLYKSLGRGDTIIFIVQMRKPSTKAGEPGSDLARERPGVGT